MHKKIGKALVIGAGISGIRAALDLAETGYGVTLIDKAPHIGGILSQLDYQFPSNRCGMCKMLPLVDRDAASQYCLRKGLFHENIEILLSTELVAVHGDVGNYVVSLKQKPNWVDLQRCIGCGMCVDVCPVEVPDEFNAGLSKRKAVYLPVPHAIPNPFMIDIAACTRCGECEKICPTGAIQLSAQDNDFEATEGVQREVGAIVLCGGTDYYQPASGKNTFGYGIFPNVLTSIEFERMLSGLGPEQGRLFRPSDRKPVRRIGWIQCVGSRDLQANADFCSSICCMHAIKEAMLAKEKSRGKIETTLFYMDMRTFEKSFQRYRDIAEKNHGVQFVRGRIHSIAQNIEGDVVIRYAGPHGNAREMTFDIMILSLGQKPAKGMDALAQMLGIDRNPWGFCEAVPFSLNRTQREGILLGGAVSGLKDISNSVLQSSAAALSASRAIHAAGGGLSLETPTPTPLTDVSRELPRILVIICTCGETLLGGIDMDAIAYRLKIDPAVHWVELLQQTCTETGWTDLIEVIKDHRPNRLIIGACQPYVYASKFNELGNETGLNPSLMDAADIRTPLFGSADMDPQDKTKRILGSIEMSIAKLKHVDPNPVPSCPVRQSALVVGGGIAGLTAALAIADHGFKVDLVEKTNILGGNLQWMKQTIEGHATTPLLDEASANVMKHSLIEIHSDSHVVSSFGEVGNFFTTIENEKGTPRTLEHGVTILATGGSEAPTTSYAYGRHPGILTQKEFAQKLDEKQIDPAGLTSVVMIQCVDSREEPRNYCSRICCASSLKFALELKAQHPDISIYILYRDMMTFGFLETYYTKARKAGVVFIQYHVDRKPVVHTQNGNLSVTAFDPIIDRTLDMEADLVILATGVVSNLTPELAAEMGASIDPDGFFQEAESKWRPVDAIKEGVFACGLSHSPRSVAESIATAEAAAQRCLRILTRKNLPPGKIVAEVRHSLCSRCERCIDACPYGARSLDIDEEKVLVNPVMCQGCGSCATVCPNSASVLAGFSKQQMLHMLDAALI